MRQLLHNGFAWVASREWLGLAIGALLSVAALLLWSAQAPIWTALLLGILALLFALGGSLNLARIARARRRYPPAGRLVDMDGYRIHLFAEGEASDALPVVWLGGGHSAGIAMQPLHDALKGQTRSILIDRPGTGWSDTGPIPRTTAREADEIVEVLARAGEKGPFVFAGYSFGGLLAANIARRHPQQVARLVLLDPTPLDTIVYGPRLGAIREMRRDALATALACHLGLAINFQLRRARRIAAHAAATSAFEQALGPALDRLKGREVGAGPRIAEWSIYRELLGPHVASCGWETVVYDGDLGDMSLWLVAPGTSDEVADTPEVVAAGGEAARMFRFFQLTRERYLAASRNARRVYAPAGSTHQFVYQNTDFVIETMREAVRP